MTYNNTISSYVPTSQNVSTNQKTSTANAALFQSILQSNQANSAFGMGSIGTKAIIGAIPQSMRMSGPVSNSISAAVVSYTSKLGTAADVGACAPVSDEDAQMREYLDIYKRIYDKYAAVYGEGFEFTPCWSFQGNIESEREAQRVQKMKDDFNRELHANIPGKFLSTPDPDFAAKAAEKGLTLREYAILQGADETKMNESVDGKYATDSITKMFYLEKYGLEGLSEQKQIDKIMAHFSKGTIKEFHAGVSILYSVGAISGGEMVAAISNSHTHAHDEEFSKALEMYDSNSWEEFFKQYYANIIFHMNRMYSAEYDWEDVFKNNPNLQNDSRGSFFTKLFGGVNEK